MRIDFPVEEGGDTPSENLRTKKEQSRREKKKKKTTQPSSFKGPLTPQYQKNTRERNMERQKEKQRIAQNEKTDGRNREKKIERNCLLCSKARTFVIWSEALCVLDS